MEPRKTQRPKGKKDSILPQMREASTHRIERNLKEIIQDCGVVHPVFDLVAVGLDFTKRNDPLSNKWIPCGNAIGGAYNWLTEEKEG